MPRNIKNNENINALKDTQAKLDKSITSLDEGNYSGGPPMRLVTTGAADDDNDSSSGVRANCSVPRSSVRSILDATFARLSLDKSSHV